MGTSGTFGKSYRIVPGLVIDAEGISDGNVHFPWHEVHGCDIAVGNDSDTIFGDDDNASMPYVLSLRHASGVRHDIPLDGLGEDGAATAALAINHFSGRRLIARNINNVSGMSVGWIIAMAVAATALALAAFV